MIVSFKKRFIFVAVPKTASQSIRHQLRQHLDSSDWEQSVYSELRFFPVEELANLGHGHLTLNQIKPYLLPNMKANFFSFAFVRNPYDRLASFCTFFQEVKLSMARDPAGTMKSVLTDLKLRNHVLLAPQCHFICNDNDEFTVSFVGKYETLQNDFDHVCRKLNIPVSTLPEINRSKRSKIVESFDKELIEMVESIYHRDFELFGYRKCIPTNI